MGCGRNDRFITAKERKKIDEHRRDKIEISGMRRRMRMQRRHLINTLVALTHRVAKYWENKPVIKYIKRKQRQRAKAVDVRRAKGAKFPHKARSLVRSNAYVQLPLVDNS